MSLLCVLHTETFLNGANNISEMVIVFVIKIQILCSLDHPILLKFCQLVVKIGSKEFQIVF